MKNILLTIAVLLSFAADAQVSKLDIQASGLTCSLCSKGIFKALKTLDLVEDVKANIKHSSFEVTIKPGTVVDFDKVKKKVEDAGFFIAKFSATVNFNNVRIVNDGHVDIGTTTFHFLNTSDQVLNGDKVIRLIDKGYVTAKEYKKNSRYTQMECYKTGVAGSCCVKDNLPLGKRIFHVTI